MLQWRVTSSSIFGANVPNARTGNGWLDLFISTAAILAFEDEQHLQVFTAGTEVPFLEDLAGADLISAQQPSRLSVPHSDDLSTTHVLHTLSHMLHTVALADAAHQHTASSNGGLASSDSIGSRYESHPTWLLPTSNTASDHWPGVWLFLHPSLW